LAQNRIAWVLFYIDARGRMVLLHGFIKKSQKTPAANLELALKNRALHEGEMMMAKGVAGVHSGSSFDDFMEEEAYRNEVESVAIQRVLAWQFEREMIRQRAVRARDD
jgi:Phage derived protein Gp49-like (DUF891)